MESASPCREANFLALPLLCKGRALGVLAVERKPGDPPFELADMELLQNIGNQAALAVESSELRESEERIHLETISALALAVEAKDPTREDTPSASANWPPPSPWKWDWKRRTFKMSAAAAFCMT